MGKQEQLVEDMKSRFQQIYKYDARVGLNETTVLGGTIKDEAEDDNAPAPADNGAGAPPADGGAGMPPMDDGAGAPPADGGAAAPEGFAPQEAPMGDMSADDFGGADTQQPGDEVLDVTELTDKQDDIEDEIKEVGGKFDKVMKAIGAFEELLRTNDQKIEDLKTEFERRNPTQVEKLSMQTAKSYPFNVQPEEFWKEKEATSNYSTEDDDNGKEQGQYVITANDVNGNTDWKSIADSLDSEDFMFNQTLDKILKM